MKRGGKGTKRPSENEAGRGRRDGASKCGCMDRQQKPRERKKHRKAMRMRIDEAQRREESFHQQVCWMKPGDKSPSGRSLGLSACTGCLSPSVICLITWLWEINGYSPAPGSPALPAPALPTPSPVRGARRFSCCAAGWEVMDSPYTPRDPNLGVPCLGTARSRTTLGPWLLSGGSIDVLGGNGCPSLRRVSLGAVSSCQAPVFSG